MEREKGDPIGHLSHLHVHQMMEWHEIGGDVIGSSARCGIYIMVNSKHSYLYEDPPSYQSAFRCRSEIAGSGHHHQIPAKLILDREGKILSCRPVEYCGVVPPGCWI